MKRLVPALAIALLLCGGPAFAAPSAAQHPRDQHTTHARQARQARQTTHVSRARQPVPKPAVSVSLTSIRPAGYLKADSTLRVSGRLVDQSESGYQRVSVRLRFSSRAMTNRGELETYADDRGPDPSTGGQPRMVATTLPVGGHASWALSLPVRQMGLRVFGVYPISVEVLGATGAVLGHQRTFVTYYPAGTAIQRTKIAWVWPLIDQPHRADDSTFVDDRLERLLGSGGRLSTLIDAPAHSTTPLSWLIDPGLVDDVTRMADTEGYTIKGGVNRPQSVAALDWLRSLHSAVDGDRLYATPYADPDVLALTQHRMTHDVRYATQQGMHSLAAARLGGATSSVAMPPDGLADNATLTTLVAGGTRTILLSSATLPDTRMQTFTPDPVVRKNVSGTPVRLVAYDDTLSRILSTGTSAPGAALVAEQRFLAETAMITGERPQQSRTVVVTPPRRWTPSPAFAKAVLHDSAKAPWLRAVPLSDVDAMNADSGRAFQPQKGGGGLRTNYLRTVRDLGTRVQRFTSIFMPPTSDFMLGIARTESSAWNGQSRRGKLVHDTLQDELDHSSSRIKVLNDGITMAGRSGRIPITISNGLTHGTVRVKLHAYSQNETRLRVNAVDQTLILEPGHKDQVTLDLKAAANGITSVNLELLAPDDHTFGGAHVLHVRATGYGRTALLITGVSLAVLFVGVAIRVVRRRAERAEESVG